MCTTRLFMAGASEVEFVDVRDHLDHAVPDELALFAQAGELGRRRRRLGHLGSRRVELALETRHFVGRARALGPERVDHFHELTDLLFEAIDGLKVCRCACACHPLLRSGGA